MAVTVSVYNHTAAKLFNLDMDANASNFYLELLSTSASFTASNTTKTAVDNAGSYEIDGFGWTTGGENLASVTFTTVATDDSMFDAADVSVTASGGDIGPAYYALIYVDEGGAGTTYTPLFFIDLDGSHTASDGYNFDVNWHSSGIARIIAP